MTDMTASAAQESSRRAFLKGGGAVAAMVVSGGAVIHTTEAWGMQPKALSAGTARSLVKIARDIFPHDRIADRFYAIAVKSYDDKAATDAKLSEYKEVRFMCLRCTGSVQSPGSRG